MTLAIIGGTGVYDPAILEDLHEEVVTTPYGEAVLTQGSMDGIEVVFLARHGRSHHLPPHGINYRANIWALHHLGVRSVLATGAVGSLNPVYRPADFVLCDQFLDFTKSRPSTFFDGGEAGVVHTDMTAPYSPRLREVVGTAASELGLTAHSGGVYVCTEGPRFETAAEIRAFRLLGGDVVGMTGVPEVVLARELGMEYAVIAVVTNVAAGIAKAPLSHQEVLDALAEGQTRVRRLLARSIQIWAELQKPVVPQEQGESV